MTVRIITTIEREDLTPRNHGKVMRQINEELGRRHQRLRVRKHFQRRKETNPASGGYRYRARSARWKAIKRRAGKDPLRPNFFTGELEQAVLSSSIVRKTQHRWTWQARGSFRMPDWQRRELEAITGEERDEDAHLMEERYAQLAQRPQFRRKRRRRVGG